MFRDIHVVGTNNTTNEQMYDMVEAVAKGIKVKTTVFRGLDQIPKLVEEAEAGRIAGKAVVLVDEKQA
jgi:D-arabinose 1-dehydrogenase-like Zn-dependent alcohol dehydrogenase